MARNLHDGWEAQLRDYFARDRGKDVLLAVLRGGLSSSVCRPVHVNGITLADDMPLVFAAAFFDPNGTLARANNILDECAAELVKREEKTPKLRFRLMGLPQGPDFHWSAVPKSEDAGRLLAFRGTVTKMTVPKMLETRKAYRCRGCGHTFDVVADYEQFYRLPRPAACPTLRESSGADKCRSFNFDPVVTDVDADACRDYQEIKIQEQVGALSLGTIPRSVWVTLEDDLVDACKPGDDVTVIGVVSRRWRQPSKFEATRTEIELAVKANYVLVNNDQRSAGQALVSEDTEKEFDDFWRDWENDPLAGRDRILASLCPQIYGMYAVKLALAVVLCGGVERVDDSGTRVRGEPHMLMVGDPGTGKSQLLKYASNLVPRSVLTTGIGSTNAGLTVSAVRDGGEWHLEAGALVLADGGICCIDEFNSIREADRTCIHEAMEQQSLSVAKAGLVCKLQTRCTILAVTNPRGFFYDPEKPLTVNTGIASPLLSRFDLVFTLLDSRNEEWDKLVSLYILEGKNPLEELGEGEVPWTFDQLQSYILSCRRIDPDLTEDASAVLTAYYRRQRMTDDESAGARTTVRLLQSSIRIAQGHARLMRRREVTVSDAVFAVVLFECSTESAGAGGDARESLVIGQRGRRNPLHSTFPDCPADEYETQAELVLQSLGLNDVWLKEKRRLDEERRRRRNEEKRAPPKSGSNPTEQRPRPNEQCHRLMTQVMNKVKENQVAYVRNEPSAAVSEKAKKKRKSKAAKSSNGQAKRVRLSERNSEPEESENVSKREGERGSGRTEDFFSSKAGSETFDLSLDFDAISRVLPTSTQNEGAKAVNTKLSDKTLSRLKEFQASQPVVTALDARSPSPDSSMDSSLEKTRRRPCEEIKSRGNQMAESIFSDPNEEFSLEL